MKIGHNLIWPIFIFTPPLPSVSDKKIITNGPKTDSGSRKDGK